MVLATGTQASGILSLNKPSDAVRPASVADVPAAAMAIEDVTPDPPTIRAPRNDVTEQLDVMRASVEDHLRDVERIRISNASLREEKDELYGETIGLHKELLQLELQVAALQTELRENTDVRTVYNFVDVPIGAGGDLSGYRTTRVADTMLFGDDGMEPYDRYGMDPNAAYMADGSFTPDESYYSPGAGMGDEDEEFGTPFFN